MDSIPLERMTQEELASLALSYLTGDEGLNSDPDIVTKTISLLTEEGLRGFDFGFYYANLLSVLRTERDLQGIKTLALAAARRRILSNWLSARHNARIAGTHFKAALTNWNRDLLSKALTKGRGLIVCTAHFGNYRIIPSDLASFGFRVWMAMDSKSASCWRALMNIARTQALGADRIGEIRLCDVERDKTAPFSIARALRNNDIVVFWTDGNLGIDGRLGASNKVRLSFLDHSISVKSGIPHLSMITGAPLLTVFATESSDAAGQVKTVDYTDWGSQKINDRPAEATLWTRMFYRELETLVRSWPDQWESMRFLHRWRHCAAEERTDARSVPSTSIDDMALMIGERKLRLTPTRVVPFYTHSTTTLLDVDTLSAYHIHEFPERLVTLLLSDTGLDSTSLHAVVADSNRTRVLNVLAHLVARGLIEVVPSTRAS
jgi:lauroyl/myristoyl acyltransferase